MKNSGPVSISVVHAAWDGLRKAARICATLVAAVAVLASPGIEAASNPASQGKNVQLRVLSSPAQWVSGGDARIEVTAAPGLHNKLQIYLNGSRVNVLLQKTGSHSLEGVIGGLQPGRQHARGVRQRPIPA